MTEEEGRTQLDVRVSGGIADDHPISANDLATLATVLQTAVRGVGTVLSGGQAGVGGRRKATSSQPPSCSSSLSPAPAASPFRSSSLPSRQPFLAPLREIYRVLFIGANRKITSYGMNVVGQDGCMDGYPWWRRFVEACQKHAVG